MMSGFWWRRLEKLQLIMMLDSNWINSIYLLREDLFLQYYVPKTAKIEKLNKKKKWVWRAAVIFPQLNSAMSGFPNRIQGEHLRLKTLEINHFIGFWLCRSRTVSWLIQLFNVWSETFAHDTNRKRKKKQFMHLNFQPISVCWCNVSTTDKLRVISDFLCKLAEVHSQNNPRNISTLFSKIEDTCKKKKKKIHKEGFHL